MHNGLPLQALVSAANTHDSQILEPLLETSPGVRGRRRRPGWPRRKPEKLQHADKSYNYPHCRRYIQRRRIKVGFVGRVVKDKNHLDQHRWMVERTTSQALRFKRPGLHYDRTEATLLLLLLFVVTLINLRRLRQATKL